MLCFIKCVKIKRRRAQRLSWKSVVETKSLTQSTGFFFKHWQSYGTFEFFYWIDFGRWEKKMSKMGLIQRQNIWSQNRNIWWKKKFIIKLTTECWTNSVEQKSKRYRLDWDGSHDSHQADNEFRYFYSCSSTFCQVHFFPYTCSDSASGERAICACGKNIWSVFRRGAHERLLRYEQ